MLKLNHRVRKLQIFACCFLISTVSFASDPVDEYSFLWHEGKEKVPLWTFSGDQGAEDTFYLVDTVRRAIVKYSRTGVALEARAGEAKGELSSGLLQFRDREFRPTAIQVDPRDSGRLMVQSFRTEIHLFEAEKLGYMGPVALGLRSEKGDHVRRLNNWVAATDFLFAYAEIESHTGDWYSAFVRIPFDRAEYFEVIGEEIGPDDPIAVRQNLGYTFMALGPDSEEVFLLKDNDDREVLRVTSLTDSPLTLSTSKSLSLGRPWQDWNRDGVQPAEQLKALEKADAVTNLFVSDDYFYLVRRNNGKWLLDRISRRTGSNSTPYILPTQAPHLLVIPGEKELLVVEKGEIRALGDQLITDFFWLRYHEVFD